MKRWMYRSGHPGVPARMLNRILAMHFSAGLLSPRRAMTLEVPARNTAASSRSPVVFAEYEGERYVRSMLAKDANWVRNARAAGSSGRTNRPGPVGRSASVRLRYGASGESRRGAAW